MPKRLVDGDALWSSRKICQIEPESFRAEYANLLPLALANGVFEYDARLIWARVYAVNRPSITPGDVEAILAEFVRVDLVRTFEVDGKQWGYFVNIDKPGRLPSKSDVASRRYQVGPPVPEHIATASGQYRDISGAGVGVGVGVGTGVGMGKVKPRRAVARLAFHKPTLEEVTAYCTERGKGVDPHGWLNHYIANGWKVGRNPMKDWKAAVRTWETNHHAKGGANGNGNRYATKAERIQAANLRARDQVLAELGAD